MLFFLLPLTLLPYFVNGLTCTQCPFNLQPPYSNNCTETCQGDLCYIVVNKFFNGTIIAGCLSTKGGDELRKNTAVCKSTPERTMCACTMKDKCNDPIAPMASFEFVEEDILDGYQIMPQITPGMPENSNPEKNLKEPVKNKAAKQDDIPEIYVRSTMKVNAPMAASDPIPAPQNISTGQTTKAVDIKMTTKKQGTGTILPVSVTGTTRASTGKPVSTTTTPTRICANLNYSMFAIFAVFFNALF